eukprot:TRINITY_DN3551_c1_g1_i2.p1 TRINITY_DN3551_c1_g1~~TRINITY_DN3551_c1_g1_i2.p1  ORF type:complete len:489 (-),score=83.13 TRINITY_DN3551_c1_g1_i2:30-1496(-)
MADSKPDITTFCTVRLTTHATWHTYHHADYIASVLILLDQIEGLPLLVRARVLATSLVRKDKQLTESLLRRSSVQQLNGFPVEVVVEALKLVDSKRRKKILQASIDKLKTKKTKATKRIIIEKTSEMNKLHEEGEIGGSLTGSLTAYMRRWLGTIPIENLHDYVTRKDTHAWKELIRMIHAQPNDFQNPKFLNFVKNFKKTKQEEGLHRSTIDSINDISNLYSTAYEEEKKTRAQLKIELQGLEDLLASGFIQAKEYYERKAEICRNLGIDDYQQGSVPSVPKRKVDDSTLGNMPFVVRADMGKIAADIIVIKVGASLMGFLGGKIETYYGPTIMTHLRKKYDITTTNDKGEKKKRKGGKGRGRERQKWKPADLVSNKPVYRDGCKSLGLQPGWTGYHPKEEMRALPGADEKAPPLVVTILGVKGAVPVTTESTRVNMKNIFESIKKHMPNKNKKRVVAIPAFCFGIFDLVLLISHIFFSLFQYFLFT